MKLIEKLGVNKFMILVLSIMGFFIIISSIFITHSYQKNIASITSSYKDSSERAASILSEVLELNHLNSMLLSALNQSDIDKLEAELGNIKTKHQKLHEVFQKCGNGCDANRKLYGELQKQDENLINNFILLGKGAEAKEFYFVEVYPKYEKLAIEIKTVSDELLSYQTKQIKIAEISYKKTLKLLIASYVILITLIALIIFVFKKYISALFYISLENSKNAAKVLFGTSEKSHSVSSELIKSVAAQSKIIEINSSSLFQISNLLNQNNDLVLQSNLKSEENKELIIEGINSLDEVNQSIQNISDSTLALQDQIKKHESEFSEITKLILEIGEKTKVINDIVFQTKLLSFNASVEAARAGEHGQGFLVVAEEVGNLAQMSGNAATEINTMLVSSVDRVNEILQKSNIEQQKLLNRAMSSVNNGNENAKQCIESFKKIDKKASEIVEYISNIKESSNEQRLGVEKILETMRTLKNETEKNSQLATDSDDLSTFLSNESQKLQDFASDLDIKLNGR